MALKHEEWPDYLRQYPVLADLSDGWKLVAHTNCPAVCDGESFATFGAHGCGMDDVLMEGARAFSEWAYKALVNAEQWPL